MNSELKPKIRFKGFTDDWEQRKLNNMCSIITKQTGFDYSATIKPSLVEHRIPNSYSFIQNKDFEGLNINLNTDFYIPKGVADQFPKITLDTPSLLISISGKIGNVGFYSLKNKAFIGGAVGICKLLNPDDGILSTYELESDYGQKYFQSLVKASSHANITVEDIRNIELILPKDSRERSNISKFLLDLDKLITLHQRKCDKLIELKKSLLKKMFPQNNSVIPEIRFKGFTDDWEQRKFKDYGTVSMCKRIFKEETSDTGDVPFYKIGTFGNQADAFINNEKYEYYKSNFSYPSKGDILLSASGTIGRIVEYTGEKAYFQDSNIVWLNHNDNIKNSFLKVLYSTVKWDGIEGSTIKRLYNSNFLNTEISLPKIQEQDKIGDIFNNIDNLITLHQRKHYKLNKIKQSLLNDMFVYEGDSYEWS